MNVKDIRSSEWSLSMAELGAVVEGVDDIKQCLNIIMYTRKGTDPLRPDFGCGAIDRIDQPVNVAIPGMIKDIIEAVTLFEPRIDIVKITSELIESQVKFFLNFKIKNSVETGQQNITYGFN